MPGPNLIAINVGNTRVQIGRCVDGDLVEHQRFPHEAISDVVPLVQEWWKQIAETDAPAIVMASVNESAASRLRSMVEDQLGVDVYAIGADMPAPVGEQLDPETITGVDRLLNAAAAFAQVQQACIVIDVGTAITIDFIDGEGTFHGGAIAPGVGLQLKALHEYTDALPDIRFERPADEHFGRNTAQAMLHGVFHGVRGLAWRMVERYAEGYGAFPQVVATGGDAASIFDGDELIDNIVPDLTLRGIVVAARYALSDEEADEADATRDA